MALKVEAGVEVGVGGDANQDVFSREGQELYQLNQL